MDIEQIRKDFEDWMGDGGLSPRAIERNSKGDYILMQTAHAWEVWKAAHTHYAKSAAPVVLPEPDSYLFQHEDTGQTMFVDAQQVEWGFEANNQRLHKVSGVYTEQQVRELLATGGQAHVWEGPVRELLSHIDDILPDDALDKIDTKTWGAVSRLVGIAANCLPQAVALDAARGVSESVTGTSFLQEEDQRALDRLIETLEDNEGFDIGKDAIKRLANIGVVESLGFGRYGVTMFGYWVHEHHWHQNPSLPLKTNLDRDADARAASSAAKENK